jgi:Chemotaxis response regulator containing a CheY-like receiver domain and a methylesterase domain
MDDIKVLIVDDSSMMRNLIGKIVESTEGLTVADKAMNGRFALQKLERVDPDVIVLDIEMPEMNGLEFLKETKARGIKIPTIVLSSLATEGARVTMDCLDMGAVDFITKPSGQVNLNDVAQQLSSMLLVYGRKYRMRKSTTSSSPSSFTTREMPSFSTTTRTTTTVASTFGSKIESEKPVPVRTPSNIQIIAIGISTGGPNALRQVFAGLDENLAQPIVVVQHMPAGFTEEFAKSLNKICPLEVKEAAEGDVIKKGRILIAPGGKHLTVEKRSLATIAHITDAPPKNGHKPSVGVLFESVTKEYQNHALGIIMTGMGKDGAEALRDMYIEGSRTLGQDEASSVVYGMPRVAWELGGVMKQISLDDMASTINTYSKNFA